MDGLGLRPRAISWVETGQVHNPGVAGPRTNIENQGSCPRPWPTIYRVRAMGVGAMPMFVRGPSMPVFNNQIAGGAPGYNISMPGMGKNPFSG
jgi:hypothetical protein